MTPPPRREDEYSALLSARVHPKMAHQMARLITSIIRLSPSLPSELPLLPHFIAALVNGSQVSSAVFHIAMIYIGKLKLRLPESACGMSCTGHRIALASIIIAEKFVCDIPMKNSAWKAHARAFTLVEVNLMEKQLLDLLDHRIEVNPGDLYTLVMNGGGGVGGGGGVSVPVPVPVTPSTSGISAPLLPLAPMSMTIPIPMPMPVGAQVYLRGGGGYHPPSGVRRYQGGGGVVGVVGVVDSSPFPTTITTNMEEDRIAWMGGSKPQPGLGQGGHHHHHHPQQTVVFRPRTGGATTSSVPPSSGSRQVSSQPRNSVVDGSQTTVPPPANDNGGPTSSAFLKVL